MSIINSFKQLIFSKKLLIISASIALIAGLFATSIIYGAYGGSQSGSKTSRYPVVNIRPVDSRYMWGGVMNFPSNQDTAIYLESYDVTGEAQITLYKASEQNLINYLIYDDNNMQKVQDFPVTDFPIVAKLSQNVKSGYANKVLLTLPLNDKTGIWYVTVKLGQAQNHGFIIKSTFGVSMLESKDSYIFWAQDFDTHKSIPGVDVLLYSLLNERKELTATRSDVKGIAVTPFSALADIALARRGDEYALVPINLSSINTNYRYTQFNGKYLQGKYFLFTDRPIYKPGDTIYFKAIVRDTEGAGYFIPKDKVQIRIGQPESPLFEKSFSLSDLGTIDGEFKLPDDVATGYQYIDISLPSSDMRQQYDRQSTSFQIEQYRKPEYFLEIDNNNSKIMMGEEVPIIFRGSYFSGNPASGLKVKYSINMSDWSDYEYYNATDGQMGIYGSYYGETLTSGEVILDGSGTYQLNIDTKQFANKVNKNKVITINATLLDNSANPSMRTRNFLLYSSDYTVYRSADSQYSFRVGDEANISYTIKPNDINKTQSAVKVKYSITRIAWEKSGKQDTFGYDQYDEKKYPIVKDIVETISPATFTNYKISFKASELGSYHVTASFTDSDNGVYQREEWIYTYATDQIWYGVDGASITLTTDKQLYATDDKPVITINTPYATGDILVALGKRNVLTFDVLPVNANMASYTPSLNSSYMPKVAVYGYGFLDKRLISGDTRITLNTLQKKLSVGLKSDKLTYGPGDTVTVDVTTKDSTGKGVPAEVAVWSMDKALTELATPASLDVYNQFWGVGDTSAYYYWDNLWLQSSNSLENINFYDAVGGRGGCFIANTKITMADGTSKNIQDVKEGDQIQTFKDNQTKAIVNASVNNIHTTTSKGYLIINNRLDVTPNHIMYVNSVWQIAGNIQVGDTLRNIDGTDELVTNIEYIDATVPVFNLSVDKYHTYIADDVWVHNQKGGSPRTEFKDTAYWNPRLTTNTNGEATIRFELPDNLTTWVVNAVAIGEDTTLGNTAKEMIVTKAVIVRPKVGNILRVGDKLKLEASIENYTNKKQAFSYQLEAKELSITSPKGTVEIEANATSTVWWDVKVLTANPEAKLVFSAMSANSPQDADSIALTLPIADIFFVDDMSSFAIGSNTFAIDIPQGINLDKSSLKLSLATSLVETLPTGLEYLISYPYGCTEQTTSRLLALLISKEYPEVFSKATSGKDIDAMIKSGISRLQSTQQPDGGWSYWLTGKSDTYITMYVSILLARLDKAGYELSDGMLNQAKYFVSSQKFDINSGVDFGALYVLYSSTVLGQSPDKSQIAYLKQQAIIAGQSAHWTEGSWDRYGSTDASTGLVLQALIEAKDPDSELRAKAIRYLTASRKHTYWSSTFATLQAMYGILKSQTKDTNNTSIPYSVTVDGKTVDTGVLTHPNNIDIQLPTNEIKGKSKVNIAVNYANDQTGYSTLSGHWAYTDTKIASRSDDIQISRSYTNAKDPHMTIGVGDLVNVKLNIKTKMSSSNSYLVIEDVLPSGLIPVNFNLSNEHNNQGHDYPGYIYSHSFDYTLTGVVIGTTGQSKSSDDSFTYQARVVSAGTYNIPPAKAQYMYLPEISGHSSFSTMTIIQKSSLPVIYQVSDRIGLIYSDNLAPIVDKYHQLTAPIANIISRPITDIAGGIIVIIIIVKLVLLILPLIKVKQ